MLKEERQRDILNMLKEQGRVVAGELSQRFGVSEDTIRRDLRELAEAGQLVRVHGGGLPHSPAATSFNERIHQASEAKDAIARKAAGLIMPGQVIILDGGTTTLSVARHLPLDLRSTVITNSPLIAAELARLPAVDVLVIGGKLFKESLVTTGSAAVEALKHFRADLCILGICSLHPEAGITTPDLEEAYVKRAMMEGSAQVVALASAEKIDTASTHIVAPISALTYLITDHQSPEEVLDAYREMGVTVIRAP